MTMLKHRVHPATSTIITTSDVVDSNSIAISNSINIFKKWRAGFLTSKWLIPVVFLCGMVMGVVISNTTMAPRPSSFDVSNNNNVDNTKQYRKTSAAKSSSPPPQCTEKELETIRFQLPVDECNRTVNTPWENRCSFSYATRCPDAVWLTEQYQRKRERATAAQTTAYAIYVGCNKAMDAVNALRMISGNASYDRNQWRQNFFSYDKTKSGGSFEAGRCGQENGEQFAIPTTARSTVQNAVVHCIEAMPVTANHLRTTAQTMHWEDHLVVWNVAMSDADGSVYFPNENGTIGIENQGIENCEQDVRGCKLVPLYRLDTFTEERRKDRSKESPPLIIDFISIDVEGFDHPVMLGATETLRRTKYIEFEYNWKGKWKHYKLSSSIQMLKDAGFVCYWAGAFGHLWRITDCWLDYYDWKFWSNVACVNVNVAPTTLTNRMEDLFQKTLAAGRQIHYGHKDTANTNGGVSTQ